MKYRKLGKSDAEVSVIGYGAMALSLAGRPGEDKAIELIHRVLDGGVTLLDTADTYCLRPSERHHNERLIAKALATYGGGTTRVCTATKGGTVRTASGWEIDGSPDRLYAAICESCEALGNTAPIGLWQHHWPDPRYPVAVSLQGVRRAMDEGLVGHAGVGNYTAAQIKEAHRAVGIVSVQSHYNLWHRNPESEGVLAYCEEEDIVFLPWRPMGGRGLAQRLGEIEDLAALARDKGVSPHRLMIAWHLAKSKCILPIPGAGTTGHITDCIAAVDLALTADDVDVIDRIPPTALPWDDPTKTNPQLGLREGP